MGGLALVARRGARRRRGSLALIVGLAALTAAVALGALAGSRRVASSYERLDRSLGIADAEVQLDAADDPVALVAAERDLVEAVRGFSIHFWAPAGTDTMPGLDFSVVVLDETEGVDDLVVVEGRLPDPDDPAAVTVNEEAADRFGYVVGDRVPLSSLTEEEFAALASGAPLDVELAGPTTEVIVTGISRHRRDIAQREQAGPIAYATPAFAQRWAGETASFGPLVATRLRPGVEPAMLTERLAERTGGDRELSVHDVRTESQFLRDATRLQSTALLLVAAAVTVAGAVAIAQAAGRHAADARPEDAVLRAVGVGPRARRLAVGLPLGAAGALGTVAGASVAALGSGLFPLGGLQRVEPDPGRRLDVPVLVGGASLLVVAFGLVVVALAHRAAREPLAPSVRSRLPLAERAATGLAPVPALGVRFALTPGADRATPVLQGIGGAVIAVAGLAAALTFASSLDALQSTPSRYGWNWDVELASGDDPELLEESMDRFIDDERLSSLARARIVGSTRIGDATVQGWAFIPVRGEPLFLTVLDGRAPAAADEVLLGPSTAAREGVAIGGSVAAAGDDGDVELRVVGLGVFPVLESEAYREGAALTPEGLERLGTSGGYESLFGEWAPGVDEDVAFASVQEDGFGFDPGVPPAVANLDEVDGFPAAVGAVLAVLGFGAVVHCVAVGSRRRRGELAVLHALGMRRRQLAASVLVQGVVLGAVGVAVGAPLGIAAGSVAWRAVASSLDVVAVADVPWDALGLVLAAVLGGAVATVGGPAVGAGRIRAAAALRRP